MGAAYQWLPPLFGVAGWPPSPSSTIGVLLGVALALIVVIEMLILFRKKLRGRKQILGIPLGTTRSWMWVHIWLGLLGIPVVLAHADFRLVSSGLLSLITLWLFLLVIASGIWGLIQQQRLPAKLYAEVPDETIASQIDFVGATHARDAERMAKALVVAPIDSESVQPIVPDNLAHYINDFAAKILVPYLERGGARSPLASPARTEQQFANLRKELPPDASDTLDKLQELAELRRQWDHQEAIQFWLHIWLLFHFPLSALMTVCMVFHAAVALKLNW